MQSLRVISNETHDLKRVFSARDSERGLKLGWLQNLFYFNIITTELDTSSITITDKQVELIVQQATYKSHSVGQRLNIVGSKNLRK